MDYKEIQELLLKVYKLHFLDKKNKTHIHRVLDISRTTVYKYIDILESNIESIDSFKEGYVKIEDLKDLPDQEFNALLKLPSTYYKRKKRVLTEEFKEDAWNIFHEQGCQSIEDIRNYIRNHKGDFPSYYATASNSTINKAINEKIKEKIENCKSFEEKIYYTPLPNEFQFNSDLVLYKKIRELEKQ